MTKIEILDNYLGEYLKDVSPDIYVLILNAMTEYTHRQVKLFAIPVVIKHSGQFCPKCHEHRAVFDEELIATCINCRTRWQNCL